MPYQDPEEMSVARSHLAFPVVGIGASAGGVAALQKLLRSLPADPGMAFVVVMHLSPEHDSMLGDILQRSGRLPVRTVVAETLVEVDHVYVISPALNLIMTDGHFRVSPLNTIEGRRSSIDLFFRSLAQAHQERAICIVLSGTGNDGAQGLRRVKELGGITLSQSPADADFDGMPQAAIRTGVVDFVLPVGEMADKLALLWRNARCIELPSPPSDLKVRHPSEDAELLAEEALVSIKALLRERTGHDFAHYKRGTVLRRLERRMQVTALPDLQSYRRLLDSEPGETRALLQDMLISVTNFFRDPLSFISLAGVVGGTLPERPHAAPFRAWVAGCATGEEAYSLAIVLQETLGKGVPIQIFASDIDERAVAAARTGLFPASIAADVGEERLRQFFVADNDGFRINKVTRDLVVFSAHNVLSDAPFTRMDLISCRNLLIYLDRVAQTRVLQTFHFALKPNGRLFLGSSETVDAAGELFEALDKPHRIFMASAKASRTHAVLTLPSRVVDLPTPEPRANIREEPSPPLESLHQRVLRKYAPPTVLVDAEDNVLHVSERASRMLRMPAGVPTTKLLGLVRPELRIELRTAMSRAAECGWTVEAPRVQLAFDGEERTIIMTVHPAVDDQPRGLLLVCFDEVRESLAAPAGAPQPRDPILAALEDELLRTQERLRNMVGETSASTEELRAANEELQTINEELRSTTEELETSREELQSVNEELITVNTELSLRVEDTSRLNDDLQNLMNSAEIGTIFVDRDLRLKRFTPQAATLFNLLPADIGRPLLHITHLLRYPELASDVSEVLRDLKRVECEVQSQDGRWLLARVVPYRTAEDRIEGVVLAFFDVSSRRKAEELLRLSEQRMRLVADSMRDYAIITTDEVGTIDSWSPGAEKIFGHKPEEAIGQPLGLIFTEEDRAAGRDAEELRNAHAQGRADDNRWHVARDGSKFFCSGITTLLVDGPRAVGYAKITRNITEQERRHERREAALSAERATSNRLQEVGAMKDEFLAVVSHELKNPLSVVQMNAQLLTRLPSVQDDERVQRVASTIKSAVSSQLQIIDDLLELSRANMGKMQLSHALVDLAELVRTIVDAVGADVERKSQRLTVELAEAHIYGDAGRVEQIVWNLVTNAVKFTPAGGGIGVRLAAECGMAVVTVTDTGIGLDSRHLTSVFEMFRQVDAGPSRRTGGLGIGLALVKQLAELHGGRVAAESAGKGHGTRFTVWLPLAVAGSAEESGVDGGRRLAGLRMLLVDDEPALLEAFGALIAGEGALVRTATSARAAVALLAQAPADVVISDIGMPDEDGYWLARTLREQDDSGDLALVAVSGMAREVDRSRAMAAGFDAHLGKPVDLELLESAVIAALRQRKRGG